MMHVGGGPDVIFSTPRHVRLPDNLVLEYEYYGCGLYPDVRGVAKDVVEGELHATHCRCCSWAVIVIVREKAEFIF